MENVNFSGRDWAMRWFTFDVDFEMYGKDLTESAILSIKFVNSLKILLTALLMSFLDEKEKNIKV